MKQALHIFRKDTRYLRYEIGLVMILAAAFGWSGKQFRSSSEIQLVWLLGAGYLITRLIHAEAIPGQRQFWITRPYRWHHLLLAKLLFILVWVNLPMLAARTFVFVAEGFPLVPSLPGLLWSQLLMNLALALPIAALATLTPSIVPSILTVLTLFGLVYGRRAVIPQQPSILPIWIPGVEWIWGLIAVVVLFTTAAPILFFQYKYRWTNFSRILGIVCLAIGIAVYLYFPWQSAFALETYLPHRLDASLYALSLDASRSTVSNTVDRKSKPRTRLDLPIVLTGPSQTNEVLVDAMLVSVETGGRVWNAEPARPSGLTLNWTRSGEAVLNTFVVTSADLAEQPGTQMLSIRGTLYLTIFGIPREKTIPLDQTNPHVMDAMYCGLGFISPSQKIQEVYCRYPFQWPAALVYGKFSETYQRPFTGQISYSPFPAALDFDRTELQSVNVPEQAKQVTIVVKQRLGTIRKDFEAQIRLDNMRELRDTDPGLK